MSNPNDALALATRFMQALDVADADAVREIYSPGARIWHNFDNKVQSVEENIKSMHWLHSKLSNVDYDIQKQFVIEDGFLQEHILRGTLASGEPFALHACAICKVEGGRITELREYLDTAEAKPLFA
jgi:ketosteroid isomerase-like protein